MTNDKKDFIDQFHACGLFYPTKTFDITGEICQNRYEQTIKNLHILDSSSGDITIKLNSEGGDVTQAKAIYDAVKSCKNHVTMVVYGQASSAASIILQAADRRVMSQNSYIMLHVGEEGYSSNHPRNIDVWHKYSRDTEKWMEDVYLSKIKQKKPRYTRNQLKSMITFDKILYPKDALLLGLIDEIGDIQ